MPKYNLIYCEGISEIVHADNEDMACDCASYPEADIKEVILLEKEVEE